MTTNQVMAYIPILVIVFFVIAIIFSRYSYKKIHHTPHRMLQTFPYEFNDPFAYDKNTTGNIFLFLSIVLEIIYCAFFDFTYDSNATMYVIVFGMAFLALFSLVLFFLPYRYSLAHLVISLLTFVFGFLVAILLIFKDSSVISYYGDLYKESGDASQYTEAIISLIITILCSLAMLFALLLVLISKNPFKLDEVTNPDGTVSYERPRVFALATMEWVTIIVNFGTLLSLMILYFVYLS
ncbi:MAG: hypothetical protein LUC31_02555 [Coprobacillus sp.]|nr:hypothetical protein [Coprobacillus sp.]